jgi:hypothetical protein
MLAPRTTACSPIFPISGRPLVAVAGPVTVASLTLIDIVSLAGWYLGWPARAPRGGQHLGRDDAAQPR